VLFVNWESVTQGAIGISGIPHMGREVLKGFKNLGLTPSMIGLQNNQFIHVTVFLILLIVSILLIWFFVRQNQSRIGRTFAAIKTDEKAAEAMGINITYYKILAFAQGAMVSAFAGALYAHMTSFISPVDFSYHRAVEILIFAVFGGVNLIWGPIFGAAFLTTMPEVLRFISDYRYVIYGILLVVMMAFRPQGIIDASLINRFKGKRNKRRGIIDGS
jgi:branched-chain amino acid transport system permease protein